MKKLSLFLLVFLCGCTGSHTLFHKGTSNYTIVIDADAPASEQYAATELQYWLREVSGVELPIGSLTDGVKGRRLIVGYNALVAEMMPDAEKPADRDDAFTWCSKGGDILFWGGAKRGTLYAVYSFLEKELGCRWYAKDVSIAPKQTRWRFASLYNHEAPAIFIRDNCYLDPRTAPAFSARLRNNFVRLPGKREGETIPGTAEGYLGVHSMGDYVSPKEFYATHPEYFSLIDGQRRSDYAQLCLSNPDVLRLCTERVRERMRRHPDYLIYSMEQNDNQAFCTCDSCTAIAERYGGQSGLMVWFVNQVADAVRDEFPDKFIGTFAYQYTRHAPTGIKPHDNVVIRLCSIECCLMHNYDDCEQNRAFLDDLKAWGAIAPHLYIWDYVTNFPLYCLPVANWKTLQPHIRDFRDNHAIGILEEGDYQTVSCEMREMRTYLLAKLMWNPDEDVDALILDFTNGYYGAAAPYIRQYLDLEERILRRPGMHVNCFTNVHAEHYTDEFVREGRHLFAEARAAVNDDPVLLARVEKEELALCFMQLERTPQEGIENGADVLFRRVVEREGIDKMTEWTAPRAKDYMEKYEKMKNEMFTK